MLIKDLEIYISTTLSVLYRDLELFTARPSSVVDRFIDFNYQTFQCYIDIYDIHDQAFPCYIEI